MTAVAHGERLTGRREQERGVPQLALNLIPSAGDLTPSRMAVSGHWPSRKASVSFDTTLDYYVAW